MVKRWLELAFWLAFMVFGAAVVWLAAYSFSDLAIEKPIQFSIKHGSGLRSATYQLESAGVIGTPWQFELLARIAGEASHIKAGYYEVSGKITPYELLRKLSSGDFSQDQISFIEGWTFDRVRAALDAHPALQHDTAGIAPREVAQMLGIPDASVEGVFFPDTYYFVTGTSDVVLLQRAYRAMQSQLDTLWSTRASGLPLERPYDALILASIVEKETAQAQERPMIAAVLINRLKLGMRLQTDPTVIYGLGAQFDGNLRKRDLLADGPYNTYTRVGLPPTPIGLAGLAALTAALNPAPSDALYFVSRGDGTSQFSSTLPEQERAVTKYQRRNKSY